MHDVWCQNYLHKGSVSGTLVHVFAWWRHQTETFYALLAICAENSPVPGEFPAQRPVTRSSDVFFDLRLNKRLSKQSWGWWFETLSRPLRRHCNGVQSCPVRCGVDIAADITVTSIPRARYSRDTVFWMENRNASCETAIPWTLGHVSIQNRLISMVVTFAHWKRPLVVYIWIFILTLYFWVTVIFICTPYKPWRTLMRNTCHHNFNIHSFFPWICIFVSIYDKRLRLIVDCCTLMYFVFSFCLCNFDLILGIYQNEPCVIFPLQLIQYSPQRTPSTTP